MKKSSLALYFLCLLIFNNSIYSQEYLSRFLKNRFWSFTISGGIILSCYGIYYFWYKNNILKNQLELNFNDIKKGIPVWFDSKKLANKDFLNEPGHNEFDHCLFIPLEDSIPKKPHFFRKSEIRFFVFNTQKKNLVVLKIAPIKAFTQCNIDDQWKKVSCKETLLYQEDNLKYSFAYKNLFSS